MSLDLEFFKQQYGITVQVESALHPGRLFNCRGLGRLWFISAIEQTAGHAPILHC